MELLHKVVLIDGYYVYITSGYYLDPQFGRVSNWWHGKYVLTDGTIGKEEWSGYGSSDMKIAKCKIETIVRF